MPPPRRRITAHEKRIVAARQGWKCALCGTVLDAGFETDHIVPLHKGGADCHVTNAWSLCRPCHGAKTREEEVERLKRAHALRASTALLCVRCDRVVSPYFVHRC